MTEISKVLIGNMALSNVGERNVIESFDEESGNTKIISQWYDWSRRSVLGAYDWNFARKRQVLAPDDDAPPEGIWAFRYQYPSSCLRIREIACPTTWPSGEHDRIPYAIELNDIDQKTILTNMEEARVRFTKDIEQTTLFSEWFVITLGRLLGSMIAFPVTGKRVVANEQLQIANTLIQQAPAVDANEGEDPPPPDADWIQDRINRTFEDSIARRIS